MSTEIRQIKKNGVLFYPQTHEKAVVGLEDILNSKANTTGYYSTLFCGGAENLIGTVDTTAEYTFRPSNGQYDITTGTATINVLKGKTLKWNQLFRGSGTGSYTISGPAEYYGMIPGSNVAANAVNVINGHKYYISLKVERSIAGNGGCALFLGGTTSTEAAGISFGIIDSFVNGFRSVLSTANATKTLTGIGYNNYGYARGFASGDYLTVSNINVIDLTEMGLDSITSPAEFEALYPLDYYAYTATPVLINNAASGIVTTGFNQWDEVTESGQISTSTGQNYGNQTTAFRSTNYIKVFPLTEYYFKKPSNAGNIRIFFYDINKEFISTNYTGSSISFTTPANCYYLRFYAWASVNINYLHDICINLSDNSRNGEYEPYEEHILYFNGEDGSLATLTGKKVVGGVPVGESVNIFDNLGLKSVGDDYDEVKGGVATKRIAIQSVTGAIGDTVTLVGCKTSATEYKCASDIGTLSNGVLTLTAAVTDVVVYYPFETPELYVLDTPIQRSYYVNNYGTEQRLPVDTASNVAAPIVYNCEYIMNAVDTIKNLPENYMGISLSGETAGNSFGNFLTALGTAMNGTWSASWNDETGTYDFEFEANE